MPTLDLLSSYFRGQQHLLNGGVYSSTTTTNRTKGSWNQGQHWDGVTVPVTRQSLVSGTSSETGHHCGLGCPCSLISNCIYLVSLFPPLRAVMRGVVSWGVCCWWRSWGFLTDSCWLGVRRSPADRFDSCDPLQAGPAPALLADFQNKKLKFLQLANTTNIDINCT